MNITSLLLVALGSSFAVMWLVNYLPIDAKFLGQVYSPRLIMCKLLAPFDAGVTLILIGGSWIGIGTAFMGIGLMTYNVLTGLGLTLGVVLTKKYLVPKWEQEFKLIKGKV